MPSDWLSGWTTIAHGRRSARGSGTGGAPARLLDVPLHRTPSHVGGNEALPEEMTMERSGMNEVLERLLGLEGLCVNGASLEREGLVVHVRVRLPAPRCGICNDFQPPYGWQPVRRWRHLTLERTPVWLSYAPRRANCHAHGVHVQRVPWAAHGARCTTEFEQMIPWLCRRIGIAATCRMMRIPWRTAARARIASQPLRLLATGSGQLWVSWSESSPIPSGSPGHRPRGMRSAPRRSTAPREPCRRSPIP
jgi:transposase ISL3 family protein